MTTMERNRIGEHRTQPFPGDFGRRLERLKELSGLSWGEFARTLDVSQTGLRKWRKGGPPSGVYFWAIMELARSVTGGYDLMMLGDRDVGKLASRE